MRRICVFCGSSPGRLGDDMQAARALGREIAGRGLGLVYGGASIGLMGAVADAALAAGGEVIGVIPHGLARREVMHGGLADLRVVESMHERKALMADLSDAFVAAPGGIGTFEELFEVWTWTQLGAHRKPCGLFNVAGFYDPLLGFLDGVVEAGFVSPSTRAMLAVADTPAALLDAIGQSAVVPEGPWLGAAER